MRGWLLAAAFGGALATLFAQPPALPVIASGGEVRGELKRGESARYELAEGTTGEVWLESRPSAFQLVWTDREGKRRRGEVRSFVIRDGRVGGRIEVRHDGFPEGPLPYRLRIVPGGAERFDVEEKFELALAERRKPGSDTRQLFAPLVADFERLGDQARLAYSLTAMGIDGVRFRDPEARNWLDRARRIHVQTADRVQEGVCHSWLGQLAQAQQRYPEARASFELAASIGRENGDRMREAIARNNVAQTLWSEGELSQAEQEFRSVLARRVELNDRLGEAYTLMGLGQVYWSQGNPQGALESYENSEKIWRELKIVAGEADCQNARGLLRFLVGEPDAAGELYERALAIWRTAKDSSGELRGLNNRGMLRASRGDLVRAADDYGRALAIARELKDGRSESYILHNLANALADQGRANEALPLYQQSLERKREIGDRWGEAATWEGLGEAHRKLGERDRAAADFARALELRQAMGDRNGEGQTRASRARLLREMGKLDEATVEARAALDLVETVRSTLANRDTRATFFASRRDVADLLVGILMDRKLEREAFEASERSRARSLLEAFGEDEIALRDLSEPERRGILTLRQRIRSLSDALSRYESAKGSTAVRDQTRTALAKAVEELRESESRARRAQKGFRAWSPDVVSVKEIQKVLVADEVLLEYWLSERESIVWEITRTGLVAYRLGARAAIEREVARIAQQVEQCRRTRACEAIGSAGLSTVVLPRSLSLNGKQVRIVADGVLSSAPFAALAPAAAAISFAPSGWLLASATLTPNRRAKQGALVVADPVFRADDIRIGKPAAPNAEGLPRLRFSREEAKAVESALPGARLLVDTAARREALNAGALANYRWLHLATHALVDDRRPLLSSLALSAVDAEGRPIDGFVRAHEVMNWRLGAEMVVLSACRSATGKPLAGEGLLGLGRAFLETGARRVVGTLWEIDDQATVELMRAFYAGLNAGRPPAVALREAQRKLATDPQWSSPYYWAGFVMLGTAK